MGKLSAAKKNLRANLIKGRKMMEMKRKVALEALREIEYPDSDDVEYPDFHDVKYPSGRRILSVLSILKGVSDISCHARICPTSGIDFAKEIRCGVQTELIFECKCGYVIRFETDTGEESLGCNRAYSVGCQLAPVGYEAATSLMTVMDIPSLSKGFHATWKEKTYHDMVRASIQTMNAAGSEEKRMAEEADDYVIVNGSKTPCIMVIVDGGWSKRSYGHSYDANSGTAVVIGARTGKILSFKTRNKYCKTCAIAKGKDIPPKQHTCYKNWTGPSTAMEADMLTESFRESINVHGLVYSRFVGDGDSSVYSKIINIYDGITVEKIECLNHAIKNFHRKLVNISSNKIPGIQVPQDERRILGIKERFSRIGGGILCAINHHATTRTVDSWKLLREDIMNSPFHIFGDHSKCSQYFCPLDSEKRLEKNLVPEMMRTAIWGELNKAVVKLANMSKSLIERMTSNLAESFMSRCNKYMEGKRKNLGQGFLYNMRIVSAVLSFNTSPFWIYDLYPVWQDKLPSNLYKTRSEALQKNGNRNVEKRTRRRQEFAFLKPKRGDIHYGSDPSRPDIPSDELQVGISQLKSSLQVDKLEQTLIEQETLSQADTPKWHYERKVRVTASDCGAIAKKRKSTSSKGILDKKLKSKYRTTIAMQYGKEKESEALLAYTLKTGVYSSTVKPAGLVVSLDNGIFAASPDAYVGEEGIVEIKCPYSCREGSAVDWLPIKNNTGIPMLKRKHNYYYQVVMQLHVTKKSWCDFVVWTPTFLHIERIHRNADTEKLWDTISPILATFWEEELAPEIVDSRVDRNRPYRSIEEKCEESAEDMDIDT